MTTRRAIIVGAVLLAVAGLGQPLTAQQDTLRIGSATGDVTRFVIELEGGGSWEIVSATGIRVTTADGSRTTQVTTPAVLSLPVSAPFTLRLTSVTDAPAVRTTVNSRSGDEVTIEGRVLEFRRTEAGGAVEVLTAGTIHSRRRGH